MPVPGPIMMMGAPGSGWKTEALVGLNVDGKRFAGAGAVGEQRGADAAAFAIVRTIANDGNGGMNLAAVRRRAGRDGVETRRETWQHGDQVGRVAKNARVIVQEVDETAVVGVLLKMSLLLGYEKIEERLALADGCVGLDHLAGEPRDLQVVEKSIVQSCRSGFGELDGD